MQIISCKKNIRYKICILLNWFMNSELVRRKKWYLKPKNKSEKRIISIYTRRNSWKIFVLLYIYINSLLYLELYNPFTPLLLYPFYPLPLNPFTPLPLYPFTPLPLYSFTPLPLYPFTHLPLQSFTCTPRI